MARSRLRRRFDGLRTVARTGALANAPRRFRAEVDAAPAAVLDTETPLPDLDLARPPWPGEVVDAGGADVFVRHTPTTAPGEAPTAVYVHGLGGASTNWTDFAGQLAGTVDGFALDLPGFGRSGPSPTGEYTPAAHTRTLLAYLETLAAAGRGPVHLFGNSMGGAISIAAAARRPDLVRTLTLISPAVPDLRVRRDDDPRAALLLVPGVAQLALRRLAQANSHARARAVIELCFGDPSRVPAHRIDEAAAEIDERAGYAWGQHAFTASMKGLIGSWFTARPWHDLAAVTAPTLVVWGDRDRLVSPALAPRVAAIVPRARLLVLEGVGHVAMLEDPVTTARAWLGTLGGDRVAAASASNAAATRETRTDRDPGPGGASVPS